ncbi:MAG: VOC family protein [Caulobacteraceae bacterium]
MKSRIGYNQHHVRQFERAVAFYRDVLGFELQFSDPSFQYARSDVAGLRVAVAAGGPEGADSGPHPDVMTGIAIAVDDVDAGLARDDGQGRPLHHGAGQAALGRLHGHVRRPGRQTSSTSTTLS